MYIYMHTQSYVCICMSTESSQHNYNIKIFFINLVSSFINSGRIVIIKSSLILEPFNFISRRQSVGLNWAPTLGPGDQSNRV